MEARLNIRRNAEEAQEAVKDLKRWADQQREKDRLISRIDDTSQADVPRTPALVQASETETSTRQDGSVKGVLHEQESSPPEEVLVSGHKSVKSSGPAGAHYNGNSLSAEVLPAEKQSSEAERLREEGNQLYRKGNYQEARKAYSRSLDLQSSAVVFANRAMVSLKLGKPAEAEADCSAALELDSAFLKAWHRRATARKQLDKLQEAAEDYEATLRLEPSSKALAAERAECIALWQKQPGIRLPATPQWVSIPIRSTIGAHAASSQSAQKSTAHEGVQSPLLVDASAAKTASLPPTQARVSQGLSPAIAPVSGDPSTAGRHSSQLDPSASVASSVGKQKAPPDKAAEGKVSSTFVGATDPLADTQGNLGLRQGRPRAEGHSGEFASSSREAGGPLSHAAPSAGRQKQPQGGPRKEGVAPLEDQVLAELAATGVTTLGQRSQAREAAGSDRSTGPEAASRISLQQRSPQSRIEFETAWRGMRGDVSAQAEYLRLLDPGKLPSIFKQSLTGPLLASIAIALLQEMKQTGDDSGVALLSSFTAVPRFAMAALSIAKQDRCRISQLWDECVGMLIVGPQRDELQALRQKYKV